MKKIGITLIILVAGTALFSSCQKEYYTPSPISIPDTVSFSTHIMPIFDASCNTSGCHNTGGVSPDLTAQNAYFELTVTGMVNVDDPEGSILYQRMNTNTNPMPPDGKLPEGTLETIRLWIEQGALDN